MKTSTVILAVLFYLHTIRRATFDNTSTRWNTTYIHIWILFCKHMHIGGKYVRCYAATEISSFSFTHLPMPLKNLSFPYTHYLHYHMCRKAHLHLNLHLLLLALGSSNTCNTRNTRGWISYHLSKTKQIFIHNYPSNYFTTIYQLFGIKNTTPL